MAEFIDGYRFIWVKRKFVLIISVAGLVPSTPIMPSFLNVHWSSLSDFELILLFFN